MLWVERYMNEKRPAAQRTDSLAEAADGQAELSSLLAAILASRANATAETGASPIRVSGRDATVPALLQNPPSSVEMGPVRGTGAGHGGLQGASL